ncbi:MAG: NERD domain-containing protein [Firmicutes bacterium]|nr:NERD domain-containing protein [Bacillota bacterium]
MVKFIPEEPYSDTKSKAEIDFFYELKENITVSDAYVFHSVGLPKHFGKIFGEADFIILCRKGILCLEVKGGNVEYKKGEWIYHKT